MDTKATKNQISESELQNEIYNGIVLLRAIKYPHLKNEYKTKVDETFLETELRKIVRQKGMPTRTKKVGTKDGNQNRSATLIGPDSTVFAQVGYGIVNPDIADIKTVADHDFGSGKGKKRKFANNINRNQDTKESLKLQLQNLKELVMKGEANDGNEVVLDIKNNGKVRFIFAYQIGTIYSNEEKYSPQTKRLLTFYIKEKIKMSLGEELPIFEYLPDIPYPKEFKEGNSTLREYISAQPDAMNELASDRQILFALCHFLKKQETCVVNSSKKNPLKGIDYEKELANAIREGYVFVRCIDEPFGYNTYGRKYNETALESELREISRHKGFPELKSISYEDGLVGATTTLIMKKTEIEGKWGYGIINPLFSDIKNINKDVSSSVMDKKSEITIADTQCSLEQLKYHVNESGNTFFNNEVYQNISNRTPISFVFAKKGYEIDALCCKEKFKNIAGKDLPVFLYAKEDSPKLYNFKQEDLQKFINTTSDVDTIITLFDYYKNNEKVLSKVKSLINSDIIEKYLSGNMHYSNFQNALKLMNKLNIIMNSDIKKTVKDFISNIENYSSFDKQNATFRAICGSMNEDEVIDFMKNSDKGNYIIRDIADIEKYILKGNFSKNRKYQLLQRNLNLAIWENNETLANILIDMKIIPDKNVDISNLVHLNNLKLLQKTLDVIKDTNLINKDQNITSIEKTALLVAIELGNIEAIELILSKDTKVDEKIIRGNIPLQQSTDKGLRGIVNHLIEKCKNPDTKNMSIKTAKDKMNDLPSRGNYCKDLILPIDIYIEKNSAQEYPMHKQGSSFGGSFDSLQTLETVIQRPAGIPHFEEVGVLTARESDKAIEYGNVENNGRGTIVIYIVTNLEKLEEIELILSKNAKADEKNDRRNTPLAESIDKGFFDKGHYLIESGENPDINNLSEKTAKDKMIELSSNKKYCENLTLPPDIYSTPNQDGKYSIHQAMESGNVENIIFVASKTPKVVFEQDNWKIMQYACKRGIAEIVKMLIDKAPPNVFDKVNTDGTTLMHLACGSGNSEIVKMIIDKTHTKVLSKIDKDGNTSMHYACKIGNAEIVKLLIDKTPIKALSQKNNSGNTPKDLAKNSKSRNIIEAAELKQKILSRLSSLKCRPKEHRELK